MENTILYLDFPDESSCDERQINELTQCLPNDVTVFRHGSSIAVEVLGTGDKWNAMSYVARHLNRFEHITVSVPSRYLFTLNNYALPLKRHATTSRKAPESYYHTLLGDSGRLVAISTQQKIDPVIWRVSRYSPDTYPPVQWSLFEGSAELVSELIGEMCRGWHVWAWGLSKICR